MAARISSERVAPLFLRAAAWLRWRFLNTVCPTGMIFVPRHNGISHNPMESATAGDLAAGARVLSGVLATLASR